ncbi:MAG: DUF3383 family protein [Chloroflexi bacterium]|nr:DUF3383 family protein [Chloroflexota bacterium]
MTLDSIIRIDATIEPSAASSDTFGRTLLLYAGDFSRTTRADVAGDRARDLRVNRYTSLAEVGEDYPTTHRVYEAAAAYFQQKPYPRDLLTASFVAAGAGDYILGATGFTGDDSLTVIKGAGASAEFRLPNGKSVNVDLASVSGSGDTGLEATATAIQTALRTISSDPNLGTATVAYDAAADAFTLAVPTIGESLGGLLSGAGAEVVGLGSTGTYYPGRPASTVAETMEIIQNMDDDWYWLEITPDLVASSVAIATWIRTERKQAIYEFTDLGVLTPNESASRAAQIVALDSERNSIIWDAIADYKGISSAGVFAGTNFNRRNSLPTLFGKTLAGRRVGQVLTAGQRNELNRKRINWYQTIAGDNVVRPGVTTRKPWFIDTRLFLDWFIVTMQTRLWRIIRSKPRVPLTDHGIGELQAEAEAVCEDGVDNGGIAPGTVDEEVAGEIRRVTGTDFDGTLSRGYLVWFDQLSEQPLADRQARKAPPFTVWLKDAGAVHETDIAIRFNQ